MSKVSMVEPEYLANDTSVADRCPEGAGIILFTEQGKCVRGFLERPTGMPGNPVSNDVFGQRLAIEMLKIDKHEKLSPLFQQLMQTLDMSS